MKTSRSRLTFAGLIAGFLAVMSMAGAAPAPPPGRPKLRLCFQADPKYIRSLEFTSDGKKLLSSGTEGAAKLWDVATGKQVATFTGKWKSKNRDRLGSITWPTLSPDGKILATAEYDSSIRLYDVATGKKLATLTQPENGPRAFLLFSRDGKTLLSLGLWGRHYLWNTETKKARVIMAALDGLKDEKRGNYMTVGTLDPNGHPLLLVREHPHPKPPNLELWTTDSDQHPTVIFPDPISEDNRFTSGAIPDCFTFSPDCKTIASGHIDYSVRLWDAATGRNTATFPKIPGRLHSLAFRPDGKVLAVGYQPPPPQPDEGSPYPPPCVGLYEVATGKVLATLTGNPGVTGPFVFSPDGRTLATTNEGPPPPRGAMRRRDEARTDGGAKIMLWSLPARYAPPK